MQMNLIIGNTSNRSYSPRKTTPPAPNPPPPQKKGYKRPTLVFFYRLRHGLLPLYLYISLPQQCMFRGLFHTDFYVNNLQIILISSSSSIIDN